MAEELSGAAPEALRDRPDIPYTASLLTPEWRIEEALRLRLAELGGAVEFGTALDSFAQSDEGVTAVVVKGGEAEAVTARWLVGCDGGHSIVRKQARIVFEGETLETMRMIVADVEADGLSGLSMSSENRPAPTTSPTRQAISPASMAHPIAASQGSLSQRV